MRRSSHRRSRPRGPAPLRVLSYRPTPQAEPLPQPAAPPQPGISPLSSFPTRKRRRMLSIVPSMAEALAGNGNSTADSVTLVLPVPPSINAQYATVQGRRVLSAAGRAYKDYVSQQIIVAFARSPQRDLLRTSLRDRLLSLSIHFQFISPMRRDLDSGLKITQDAVCEALGLNDNRIVELHLSKQLDPPEHPRITVTLRALPSTSPGAS